MLKSALCLALVAGSAGATELTVPGRVIDDSMARTGDQLKNIGWFYQVGNERVHLQTQTTGRSQGRVSEVEIWRHNEPVFDPRDQGTAVCGGAILFGATADNPTGTAPVQYEAWAATGQFEPDTVIDGIQVFISGISEPLATQNDSVADPVEFNDLLIIVEEQESVFDLTDNSSSGLTQRAIAVLDLPGDDTPVPGFSAIFALTLDLAGSDNAFELGDSNGMAEEDCVGDRFNANSFLDFGNTVLESQEDNDSLHDAMYTLIFFQPDGAGGQIDPQNATGQATEFQGYLMGYSDQFALRDPLQPNPNLPTIASSDPGSARGSFDVVRIWDLTAGTDIFGIDFDADPTQPDWLNDFGGALLLQAVRLTTGTRLDSWPDWVETEFDVTPFDQICTAFTVTSSNPANGSFEILPKTGSEPAIGFFGPTPGTCGDMTGPEPCSPADFAMPFGIVDIDDVDAFIALFLAGCP